MKETKPKIIRVLFNKPATIIFWSDGTKTVSKCSEGDTYNKEVGFLIARAKKFEKTENIVDDIDKWVYGKEKAEMAKQTKQTKKETISEKEAAKLIGEMIDDLMLATELTLLFPVVKRQVWL